MTPEDLAMVRSRWIDELIDSVVARLWPGTADHLALTPELDDPLGRALLVSHIAVQDLRGFAAVAVARSLLSSGLVVGDVDDAVTGLINPVFHEIRFRGVPGPRWWDIDGLNLLLLELWSARRSVCVPQAQVRAELQRYWSMSDLRVMDHVLDVCDNPFAQLLPPLHTSSLTGTASRLLQAASFDWPLQEMGDDRSDLSHLRLMFKECQRLAVALQKGGPNGTVREKLVRDLRHWKQLAGAALAGLTTFEVELLARDKRDDFRDRCLGAGAGIYYYRYAMPGGLPSAGTPQRCASPEWMQDEIINGGARCWHDHAGPLPFWLATVETAEHERLLAPLRRGEVRLGCRRDGDAQHIDFHLDTEEDPLELPFIYSLDYVIEAWQLLLVASVGQIRLFLLRLTDEGRLSLLDTVPLLLPPELRDELASVAMESIRSAVGDDIGKLREALSFSTASEIASATFEHCERAKSEDLLDELTVVAPDGVPAERWKAFQDASRSLARHRANRIRQGEAASSLDDEQLARAVELRTRRREEARPTRSRSTITTAERANALPLDTAFVHFHMKDARLGAVWLARTRQRNRLEYLYFDGVSMAALESLVGNLSQGGPFPVRVAQLDLMQAALAQVGAPLAESLLPLGVRRLILSPAGSLDRVPLHAAPTSRAAGAPALADVFEEIAYVPSMRILDATAARTTGSSGPVLLVAGAPLAGVNAEVEILRARYAGARVFRETEASPQSVLTAMRGAGRVHIACHGRVSDDRWANGLMLGGGCLTVADVLADGDLTGVEVVVLSACHTGTHRVNGTIVQALRGFDAACFARGARHVVSTLWEVSDVAALTFSAAFHAALPRCPVAQAFREAVAFLRHGGDIGREADTIERVYPGWSQTLAAERRYGLWSWGAFKLTGGMPY